MGISKLPRKVFHKDRKNKGVRYLMGDVVAEASIDQTGMHQNAHYRKVIQLIKRSDGTKDIRLGYYLKDRDEPESKFRWGSQTTFQLGLEDFKELLNKAKKKGII